MEHEEMIVTIFRRELEKQGKRPTHLSKENNPDSTISNGRIFAIFKNTYRLAFSDFIQICQLLHISPVDVLAEIFPSPNHYKISPEQLQLLESSYTYAKELTQKIDELEQALKYAKEITQHKNTQQ